MLSDMIIAPIYTEKATRAQESRKFVFKVAKNANKTTIKRALKMFFDIEALKINTCNVPGKTKIFRGIKGRKSSYKKAIITISQQDMEKLTNKGVE